MSALYIDAAQPVPEIPDDRYGLTKLELDAVIAKMPSGMAGFLSQWGLHQYGQAICRELSAKDLSHVAQFSEVVDPESQLQTLTALVQHLSILLVRAGIEGEAGELASTVWRFMHQQNLLRPALTSGSEYNKALRIANNC